MSDTPRTDALQEELASMPGPECLYTEEMADRMWFLMQELERQLTYLYANCIGDSMALGIMQLQRKELSAMKAERDAAVRDSERYSERYRFLRDEIWDFSDGMNDFWDTDSSQLDSAIDSAIAARKP